MPFDPNEIAAKFVAENIGRVLGGLGNAAAASTKKLALQFQPTYANYLSRLLARYEKSKPFLVQDEPLPLAEFYVPVGVKLRNKSIPDPDISKLLALGSRVTITGLGGSGKSVLLRHLLLTAIENNRKLPIFFELRHLNESSESLLSSIRKELDNSGFPFGAEHLESLLKAGEFICFFDGLDEVDPKKTEAISREILTLAKRYPKNAIVLTSRPDIRTKSWNEFVVLEMEPLTLAGARKLIGKVPYDPISKNNFLQKLDEAFYRKHQHFVSNPLLLSIMLLTFGQIAEVPDRMSVFLGQAYEVLFQRHDALKGGYKRQKHCGLDILDFTRILSLFCLVS